VDQMPTILGGLILAGIVWLIRTTSQTDKAVGVLEARAKSDDEEIKRVRVKIHDLANTVEGHKHLHKSADERTDRIERRVESLEGRKS
jgi:hypothetical protein